MQISQITTNAYGYTNTTNQSSNPSAVAIDQSFTSQANGLDQGSENISSTQDLLSTADGAADSITQMLQDIRSLAVQASNGTYTTSDKQNIQDQIEQLKSGIDETIQNTNYNTINVFSEGYDGNVQVDTNSSSASVSSLSLESLGIADFDVTGDFDIGVIDDAIESISDTRSSIGAQDNALSYMKASTDNARQQVFSSQNNLYDDLTDQILEFKRNNIIQQYQIAIQKKQMASEKSSLNYII